MTLSNIVLTNSHIIVGNSSNQGADVAMSGDVTMDNAGVTTIKSSVALAGSPTTTTQSPGDNSTRIATTAYVDAAVSSGGGASPVVGTIRNGKMSVTTASATATFTADEIVVQTSLGGASKQLSSYSQSINLGTTGAGGMDTGSAPTNGFVSLYAIAKSDGTKNILACNVTTSGSSIYGGANMPSGYTYSAFIGVWPTNGSGQFILGYQRDRRIWFPKVNALNLSGGSTPTSMTSLSISSLVPSNAVTVSGVMGCTSNSNAEILVASDSSGTAQQMHIESTNSGVTVMDGFYSAGIFTDLPLITAQTIYYRGGTVNVSMRIDVNGYTF
jgi:hypothetical protein